MARCEEGYLCEVCEGDVENLRDSGLYLQFILGWIDPETLHTRREIHIRCLPALAQFITDPGFEPLSPDELTSVPLEFNRQALDPRFVAQRTTEVTRAWQRLRDLDTMRERPPVIEYLLPEVAQRWR